MIPTSKLFQESMRFSRTMFTEADIIFGGKVLENDVPISSGSVTTDRGSNTRYSAALEVALYPWDKILLNSQGTRVRVRRGVESIGTREAVSVGEYQVYDYKRTNRGSLAVTCKGLENVLIEDAFLTPRTPPYGVSTVFAISTLIKQSDPAAEIVVRCSRDRVVTSTAAWEKERWSAVTKLADSIEAEVYCGHDGRWYIVDAPDLTNLVPVFILDAGPTGVLVEQVATNTRQGVYNGFSVSGTSTDQSVPPVVALAVDQDPASPTYYFGPYGKVNRFYSSQFFTTTEQCQAYANRLLSEAKASNSTLGVGASPLPLLEAGDPVLVRPVDLPEQVYLIQKTTLPLGNGTWSAELLSDLGRDPDEEASAA